MDQNDYGEPVMSVLREKYAHLSLLLRKQIEVSFLIDAQMFVNQDGIAWDDVHRKDLETRIDNFFVPLRSKKAERFEKLLGVASSHSIGARGSCAPQHHAFPAFLNLNGRRSLVF